MNPVPSDYPNFRTLRFKNISMSRILNTKEGAG
jgi:hypothetical protein